MPKKTKEQNETGKEIKKTTTTKSSKSKNINSTKKNSPKASSTKTVQTTKKSTTVKKSIARTKNASHKKTSTNNKKSTKKKTEILEYYDLPYRYNQTIVKVLAQTPTSLFIYWDISDADRKKLKEQYGENFFETSKPILIVYNDTLGYNFEVEINDFANSWYLNVADSKCDYRVELGRRPITTNDKINTDYVYVSTSNEIESPNDHILFDNKQKMVYFKDVKTGIKTTKSVNTISFIRNMGRIYNISDLYKKMYKSEDLEGIYDASNPSS